MTSPAQTTSPQPPSAQPTSAPSWPQPLRPAEPTRLTPRHPAAGLRIGDAERDRVCEELADHFAAGRLTVGELNERSDRAVSARTVHDLADLTVDLPRATAPGLASTGLTGTGLTSTGLAGTGRMGVVPPPPNPIVDAGRAVAVSLFGLVSLCAAMCTVLLLAVLGTSTSSTFAAAALAAFGATVGTAGFCYFAPKLWGARPVVRD